MVQKKVKDLPGPESSLKVNSLKFLCINRNISIFKRKISYGKVRSDKNRISIF